MMAALFFLLTFGIINWSYAYLLGFLLVCILRPLMQGRSICFNFLFSKAFWLLLLAGVIYALVDSWSIPSVLHHGVLPLVAFAIGWVFAETAGDEEIRDAILGGVMGFGAHAALNDYINIGHNRYGLVDVWTGAIRAATGSGALNTMTVSAAIYTLFIEKRRAVKLILILLLAVTIHYMFVLGTRAQFVILMVVVVSGVVLFSRRGNGVSGIARRFLLLAAVVALGYLVYRLNLFSVRDAVLDSNLVMRYSYRDSISRSDSFRMRSFVQGLRDLVDYPLGGRSDQLYRHNMWLDVGRVAGIVPFVFLVGYSLSVGKSLWSVFRDSGTMVGLRYLLISLYIGVFINFFMEPIWEGALSFFLATCVIDGMVSAMERRLRSERGAEETA